MEKKRQIVESIHEPENTEVIWYEPYDKIFYKYVDTWEPIISKELIVKVISDILNKKVDKKVPSKFGNVAILAKDGSLLDSNRHITEFTTTEVNVDSTNTLRPEENAEVLNIGTVEKVKLVFNIPKGDKGDKGEQGNSGYSGNIDELEVVNNIYDGGEDAALSAEMGKFLYERLVPMSEQDYKDIYEKENKFYALYEEE